MAKNTNLTDRWFIDDAKPLASGELTQELRVLDMVPGSELDRKLVEVDGLRYSAVSLRGARILARDANAYEGDDEAEDQNDADASEPEPEAASASDDTREQPTASPLPFEDASGEIVLPVNGLGRMMEKLRARTAVAGASLGALQTRLQLGDGRALAERIVRVTQHPRFNTAIAGAIALAVVGVCGVALAAAGGAAEPEVTPIVAQQRALQRLAIDFAMHRLPGGAAAEATAPATDEAAAPAADMVFDESALAPEPEVSHTAELTQGDDRPEPRVTRRRVRRHRWSRR